MKSGVNPFTGKVTPQAKILDVSKRLGNRGIGQMQGTTVSIYDTLPLATTTASTKLQFFANTQTAANTFQNSPVGTNVTGGGSNGLLGAGETLTIQEILFSVITVANGQITALKTPENSGVTGLEAGFYAGNFSFNLGNQTVAKPISNRVFLPDYNSSPGATAILSTYQLQTDLVIPPFIPFFVEVWIPPYTIAENTVQYLQCTINGVGSILNLKQNV